MARVASIKRESCVCLFHWHQLRARNNVCSCPLLGHSVRLSRTSLQVRLYRVMDEVGRRLPTYRRGTKWCISCRKNADKIFSTMDYHQMPRMRIRLCSNPKILLLLTRIIHNEHTPVLLAKRYKKRSQQIFG